MDLWKKKNHALSTMKSYLDNRDEIVTSDSNVYKGIMWWCSTAWNQKHRLAPVNCNKTQNVPSGTGMNCTSKNNHSGVKSITHRWEEMQKSPANMEGGSWALSIHRS